MVTFNDIACYYIVKFGYFGRIENKFGSTTKSFVTTINWLLFKPKTAYMENNSMEKNSTIEISKQIYHLPLWLILSSHFYFWF